MTLVLTRCTAQPVPRWTEPTRDQREGAWTNMQLKGKVAVVIGERDGVPGPAIQACLEAAGARVGLVVTQCFV